MKILCETRVVNRDMRSAQLSRMIKATLAIGFHQTSKDENGNRKKELEIIHFTTKNKMGTRYKLRDNIKKIFTRFIKDGKVTISFKQPEEDLMISCDPIQLKSFMQTLKLGLEGKDSINLKLNIANAKPIPQKSQPVTELTITNSGAYPTEGFPSTLEHLNIIGLQLHRISQTICSLKCLTELNLTNNKLRKIPDEIGNLRLTYLNLSDNFLGLHNCWKWLKGEVLRKHLLSLDLSNNEITYFSSNIIKCDKLYRLALTNNQIERVPFGIRRLNNLRDLHLANNLLPSLPSTFNSIHLDLLDISGNPFLNSKTYEKATFSNMKFNTPPKLWQLCCKTISQYKIPCTKEKCKFLLPQTLNDTLLEAPRCACGHIVCYNYALCERAIYASFTNVTHYRYENDLSIYFDIVLCGPNCMGKRQMLVL